MKRQIRTKEKVTNQSEHKARKTKGKKSINKEVFKSLPMGVTAITDLEVPILQSIPIYLN